MAAAANRTQIRRIVIAFATLFCVSFYRQYSLRHFPEDPFRTYILYVCYVLLIGAWIISLQTRITQNHMRILLVMEALVTLTGLTIRFLQDTYWVSDIVLMRKSGLWVGSTLIPGLVLAVLASLGIGQWDRYRIPQKWYLLLLPAAVTVWLCITDERRHFMFYLDEREPQPNLQFHPYIGSLLMLLFAVFLMTLRTVVIHRRNRIMADRKFLRLATLLFEPVLVLLFTTGYYLSSLQLVPALANVEVIELFARLYFIEAVTWEFYILIGLVPVNTHYADIFRHASVGMQIILADGFGLSSECADQPSEEQLQILDQQAFIATAPGKLLHMHRIPEGRFLWTEDISDIQEIIDELHRTEAELAQEGELLAEELKTKNQRLRLAARNQIYSELTEDTEHVLNLMKKLTDADAKENEDKRFTRLIVLGTYFKRRCNLKLTAKETGRIPAADLVLSFRDQADALNGTGIPTAVNASDIESYTAGFSLFLFDLFERVIEYGGESIVRTDVFLKQRNAEFSFTGLCAEAFDGKELPDSSECHLSIRDTPDGCRIFCDEEIPTLEGGDSHV